MNKKLNFKIIPILLFLIPIIITNLFLVLAGEVSKDNSQKTTIEKDIDKGLSLSEIYITESYTDSWKEAIYEDKEIICSPQNLSCQNTTVQVIKEYITHTEEKQREVKQKSKKIKYQNKEFEDLDVELICREDINRKEIVCDNILDGNGDGICQAGETCCIISKNKIDCNGHRQQIIEKKIDRK